jgi:hypothetical protein
LRATALARREHATQATLNRARAHTGNPRQRAERLAQAEAHQQLANSIELREATLADTATQRARWHDATTQARASARDATEELRRRLPDADLRPFHDKAPEQAPARQQARPATRTSAASPAEPGFTSAAIARLRDRRHWSAFTGWRTRHRCV